MLSNRLALRLGAFVLLITAAVMLLAGGALIGYSWKREWTRIDQARADLAAVRLPVITAAVWDLSRFRMQEELEALLTIPHLEWCELRLTRFTLSAGDSSGLDGVVDTFSLVHPLGGRLGVLETRFDRNSVLASVRDEALALLGLVALVVCVLAAAILVLFRFMVSRNLEALARHSRSLTLDSLSGQFRLPRGERRGGTDELDNLLEAFNQMRHQPGGTDHGAASQGGEFRACVTEQRATTGRSSTPPPMPW
jgi:HAMP domain-containing protein